MATILEKNKNYMFIMKKKDWIKKVQAKKEYKGVFLNFYTLDGVKHLGYFAHGGTMGELLISKNIRMFQKSWLKKVVYEKYDEIILKHPEITKNKTYTIYTHGCYDNLRGDTFYEYKGIEFHMTAMTDCGCSATYVAYERNINGEEYCFIQVHDYGMKDNEEKKVFIHYGNNHIEIKKYHNINSLAERYINKPLGFWGSPANANIGWDEYVTHSKYIRRDLTKKVRFTLKPESRILEIKSDEDQKKLFPYINNDNDLFNWEKISQDYDAIIVWISRLTRFDVNFDDWDVDSIVVINMDIIETLGGK